MEGLEAHHRAYHMEAQEQRSNPIQVVEDEESRRMGSTEHELWEESGDPEDLALVCVGQEVRRLLGSVAVGSEAKGFALQEQRGEG
jgi:hypothetical protein